MPIGEKLYEEKAKVTMSFIESMDKDGMVMKQSFESEVKGMGKFPSGMNMGSGTMRMGMDGKGHGKWMGMMMTKDGDMITWHGNGKSIRSGDKIKGVMLISYMTMSEKLKWLNNIIVVSEISAEMMEFTEVGYEWK